MNPYLDITPDVRAALAANKPVVALESTVIAHGMAYPQNLETALVVEAIVREGGAVPATIAVIGGRLKAGLNATEIEHIARANDMMKATARDLPYLAATGGDGATTVAATMRVAALAGIRIFATGGIGGVHRGAAQTFDISADLTEMTQSPVAVVAAGAKSILDIGATLERLETLGVPVIVYGAGRFPAFYIRDSGFPAPLQLNSATDIARMMQAQWSPGFSGGLLIANPIPSADEVPAPIIDRAITQALAEMEKQGIGGKKTTPYLLAKVAAITGGDSLKANMALIHNNARLAAEIAVAFAALSGS
ncbi:MAG: pseudouridine-5'-phosphate glycosidase [Dongiaceae bacterium]